MAGHTLALVAGTSDLPDEATLDVFRQRLAAAGLKLKLLYMISDRQKFEEIARSELMIFPSLFEGFGYPPVEAGFMGTPCIAYDLPVLQEFNVDHAHFTPWGDHEALRQRIGELLRMPLKDRLRTSAPNVRQTATLKSFSAALQAIFDQDPGSRAASGFSVTRFKMASQIYKDNTSEPRFNYATLSRSELAALVDRYRTLSQTALEAIEAAGARGMGGR